MSMKSVKSFVLVLVLLASFVPSAFAQPIPTERLDTEADYPLGGVLAAEHLGGFVAAWSRGGIRSFGIDTISPGTPVLAWYSAMGERETPIRTLGGEGATVTEPLALASANVGLALVILSGEVDDESRIFAQQVAKTGFRGPLMPIDACQGARGFDLAVHGTGSYLLVCGDVQQSLGFDGRTVGPARPLAEPDAEAAETRVSDRLDDGSFWFTWTESFNGGRRVVVQRRGPDGLPRTQPASPNLGQVTPDDSLPDVAALPDGGAVAAWETNFGSLYWVLDPNGVPQGNPRVVALEADATPPPPRRPRVAVNDQGVVTLFWREFPTTFANEALGILRVLTVDHLVGGPRDLTGEIEVEGEGPGELAFGDRGRLGILAFEERLTPDSQATFPSPRLGTVRIGALVDPPGEGVVTDAFPGFRFWVRIGGDEENPRTGVPEPICQPETVCFSGALPERSEVEVRIVGPKPNGYLWPNVVRFTTSQVEVWIEQIATGERRFYRLEAAERGSDELDGLFDRFGFLPE